MILQEKTDLKTIYNFEPRYFDEMLKIVIDRKRKVIAVNAEMHSDLGIELYDAGSEEIDLFGANIYWEDGNLEWTSTLNVNRNRELNLGTFGREIKDESIIMELTDIVNMWIYR